MFQPLKALSINGLKYKNETGRQKVPLSKYT